MLETMKLRQWLCGIAIVAGGLVGPEAAKAAPIINVGAHELQPDTPGQTIQIFVSGGDAVQGLTLNAQVADGGPEAGGLIDGPAISDVDILTGAIFGPNNTGEQNPEDPNLPQFELRTTTTSTGTVSAQGLLATLTIDTTGFFGGAFELRLADTINDDTNFAGVEAVITNGTITIVPEPATLSLLAGVGVLALRRRRP